MNITSWRSYQRRLPPTPTSVSPTRSGRKSLVVCAPKKEKGRQATILVSNSIPIKELYDSLSNQRAMSAQREHNWEILECFLSSPRTSVLVILQYTVPDTCLPPSGSCLPNIRRSLTNRASSSWVGHFSSGTSIFTPVCFSQNHAALSVCFLFFSFFSFYLLYQNYPISSDD